MKRRLTFKLTSLFLLLSIVLKMNGQDLKSLEYSYDLDLHIPSTEELMQKAAQPSNPPTPPQRQRPVSRPMTMDEAFSYGEQVSRATNLYYGTGFTEPLRTPEKYAKKYVDEDFGFHPAVDNEAFYSENKNSPIASPTHDNPSYEELINQYESNREKNIFLFSFFLFLVVFFSYQLYRNKYSR